MLPQIKKTISSFLSEEEGKISKQSLLTVGALLGAAIVAQPVTAAHTSNLSHTDSYTLTNPQPGQAVYSHQHYDPSQSVSTTSTTSCGEDSCGAKENSSPLFQGHTDSVNPTTGCSGVDGCVETHTDSCGSGEATHSDAAKMF